MELKKTSSVLYTKKKGFIEPKIVTIEKLDICSNDERKTDLFFSIGEEQSRISISGADINQLIDLFETTNSDDLTGQKIRISLKEFQGNPDKGISNGFSYVFEKI